MIPGLYFILLLATIGLAVTIQIRLMQTKRVPMTCPIGGKCNKVLNSKYNKIAGIPIELFGMAYYASLMTCALLLLSDQSFLYGFSVSKTLLLLSSAGLFFSTILTYLQAYVIKAWCPWCLTSAIVTTTIFLLELKFFYNLFF